MNNISPKFSIITVTYNAEQWLERTILSVLSQSYPNIEYIIIDGKSKDKTLDIIRQYESGITYWISEPDKGLYDAMNKGLQNATGDYVWFLNAGDTLPSADIIQLMVQKMSKLKNLPDVIYGETAIAEKDGKIIGMRRLKAPRRLTWQKFRWGMLVCHQSFIARKAVTDSYNLSYPLCADYDWCIRVLKASKRVFNTRLTLSNFLEAGLSSQQRKASLKERYAIMCNYYGTFATMLMHLWFAVRFYYAKWVTKKVI